MALQTGVTAEMALQKGARISQQAGATKQELLLKYSWSYKQMPL